MSRLRVRNNDSAEELPDKLGIALLEGQLGQNLDEIEQALLQQEIGLFLRNGGLVLPGAVSVEVRGGRTIEAVGLIEANANTLIEIITGAAMLGRYNASVKRTLLVNCPKRLAEAYMSRRGRWGLRALSGILNAPTLRPDGSLLDQPGYDRSTGLLYIPQPDVIFPAIPEAPSRAEALAARSVLDELICSYPFVSLESRSVALAAFLTGVIRPMLPTAPGFGFTSPVAGSGKGLLCDTIGYVAHGRLPSSLTQGNAEETEKRISAALMRGDTVICIDNITEPITGAKLLSVLTQQVADLRPLGSSKLVAHETRSLFLFNGNNLTVPGDMCRRLLVCGIDPRCENPERRSFDFDPLMRAKSGRGRYVMAALTILRAYLAEERVREELRVAFGADKVPQNDVLGSYAEWSRWVRDALLWLGEADPIATIQKNKSLDPEAERLGAVVHHWGKVIGVDRRVTVKRAIAMAEAGPAGSAGGCDADPMIFGEEGEQTGLIDAFHAVAAPMTRGSRNERVDSRRLGNWLGKYKDRVIGGYRIVLVPEKLHGDAQWCLERVG